MNAFCWASFLIGSQICFNFWVKLAALLWQLRQELFQPFLAVLPLRPWDCHFQPFDNCTIGTFFAENRFHRRPCHVIWFLIFNLPRQKCLHLQILAFAISEYLGKWKNMATVFASLKHPSKNILRGVEDNHDQSGLSLIISRVMVEKQPLRPGETKELIACWMKTQQMSITLILDNHQLIISEIRFKQEKSHELP